MIDLSSVPSNPGVYLWKNEYGQVIYVGKAKNLKNRMNQYFDNNVSSKTKLLVKEISDFSFQITNSEIDALILEQNLINEFEPKFNIKIKSAKRYPYINVSFTDGIKLTVANRFIKNKKSQTYGPFPDGFSARNIIRILNSVLPIDKCLKPNSGVECINYQIGKCLGYCIKEVNQDDINLIANKINDFFSNRNDWLIDELKNKIDSLSKQLKFEECEGIKKDIEFIENLNANKIHEFNDGKHRDIISVYEKDNYISLNITNIRFGHLGVSSEYFIKSFDIDWMNDVKTFIFDFYKKNLIPDEIITDLEITDLVETIITPPIKGKKRELLDNSTLQAKSSFDKEISKIIRDNQIFNNTVDWVTKNVGSNIDLSKIAIVDIASLMGSDQVGTVITVNDGIFDKSNYRKFILDDIEGMNDYAAIEEVTFRYFRNLLEHKGTIPTVYIVDGKNQINNAINSINKLGIRVKVIALTKNSKHQTDSIFLDSGESIKLDKTSDEYLFFSKVQDEVHRFTINFYRSRKAKNIFESELDKYQFLNENDKLNLVKSFGTVRKILIASESELSKVISSKKAKMFINENI